MSRRKLSPNGSLTILQPNYRYAYREYFDDFTHVSIYSHVSLCDFLMANGFEIVAYDDLSHRVDQGIERDVVVARKSG